MNRIDRLFSIHTLLQTKKFVTAEKIADKFNLSIRTVYRDIKALAESGVPVSFEPGKGYFIVSGYFLPPVSFTTDEANAFLLVESLVTGFSDKSIQQHYSSGLNKLKSVLRSGEKDKIEALGQQIKLQIPACMKFDLEYLSHLQTAISRKCMIDMDYKSKAKEVSKRRVEPIGLIFYAMGWHVIAWCHLRNDYRDFKVWNILKLSCTDVPFNIHPHIDVNDYMKNFQWHTDRRFNVEKKFELPEVTAIGLSVPPSRFVT